MSTTKNQTSTATHRPGRSGFTLIEVLVVVAIIALLISILLPSLRQAREQAKITACQANCKQIATMTTTYQTEYQGNVPIILNYYANGDPNHMGLAKNCWLSVALRMYNSSTRNMQGLGSSTGVKFDPNQRWDGIVHRDYQNRLLPDFYICPFERGKGPLVRRGPVHSPTARTDYYEEHGKYEAYQTALWPFNVIKNQQVSAPWPGGPGNARNGIAKYSTINWNQVTNGHEVNVGSPKRDDLLNKLHRRWKDSDSWERRPGTQITRGGGGLSQLVTVFCAQGEHMVFSGKESQGIIARDNVGSHRTFQGGGTNIIFADTHVEWVLGTRMGWP